MPEVSSEEIGRRMFELQKERTVEDTIDKIRLMRGVQWTSLPPTDKEMVKHILGEAWVSMERRQWDRCVFSRLTEDDLELMVRLGRELHAEKKDEITALNEVIEVLNRLAD
jgi:hypothetical protein